MLKMRPRHPLLEVRMSEWNEGTCLVECAGEVDIETAPRLRDALERALEAGARRLVLNLAAVTFMDSVGVGQIVSAYKRLRPGARLQICTSNQNVRMLLQIAGLNGVSSMHQSLEEALRAA